MCLINQDSQIVIPPTTVVPKAFYKLGNDSYKLVAQKMKWDEARRQCQADDADLASILNPIVQASITLQIHKYNEPVWIGLNNNVVMIHRSSQQLRCQISLWKTFMFRVNFNEDYFFFVDQRAVQMG